MWSNTANMYLHISEDQVLSDFMMYLHCFVENFKTFSTDYGHSSAFSLSEALWTCQNMFATR